MGQIDFSKNYYYLIESFDSVYVRKLFFIKNSFLKQQLFFYKSLLLLLCWNPITVQTNDYY